MASEESARKVAYNERVEKESTAQTDEPKPVPAAKQSSTSSFSIGSAGPAGGIVFYVDSSGAHSLEAKTADEPNKMSWDAAMAANYGSGWRLPTKDELNQLYSQKTVVGGFAYYPYWSSSDYDSYYAWTQNFSNGLQYHSTKNSQYPVRAVRAF